MNDTAKTLSANGAAPHTVAVSADDDIQITVLPAKANIVIDMSKLTWGDQLEMQKYKARSDDLSEEDAAAILNRLIEKVTGQDPLGLPGKAVERIIDKLFDLEGDGKDRKNSTTGS